MMRVLYGGIVLFWLVMTGLLIHSEVSPRGATLREVPFEHVLKVLFHHQQESGLSIYSDAGARLGHFRFEPKVDPESGDRRLRLSGHVSIRPARGDRQRFQWEAVVAMKPDYSVHAIAFQTDFHSGETHYAIALRVAPAENRAWVRIKTNDRMVEESTYTLDREGAAQVLNQLWVDPALIDAFSNRSSVGVKLNPQVVAQQSSMEIRGEGIQTYLVSLQHGGQTLIDAHVSQLGQVLKIKTFFGYHLTTDDLIP